MIICPGSLQNVLFSVEKSKTHITKIICKSVDNKIINNIY